MAEPGKRAVVHAAQGDAGTRKIRVELYDGGDVWNVPEGLIYTCVYCKPDGRGGEFDTLPDGSRAVSIESDNHRYVMIVTLPPQTLTTAGVVPMAIVFRSADGYTISTYRWNLLVEESPESGIRSEDYFNVVTFNGMNRAIEALRQDLGVVEDAIRQTVLDEEYRSDTDRTAEYRIYQEAGFKAGQEYSVKVDVIEAQVGPKGIRLYTSTDTAASYVEDTIGDFPSAKTGYTINKTFTPTEDAKYICLRIYATGGKPHLRTTITTLGSLMHMVEDNRDAIDLVGVEMDLAMDMLQTANGKINQLSEDMGEVKSTLSSRNLVRQLRMGLINSGGEITTDGQKVITGLIPVDPTKPYAFTIGTAQQAYYVRYNEDGTHTSRITIGTVSHQNWLSFPAGTAAVCFMFSASSVEDVQDFMFAQTTDKTPAYEPYELKVPTEKVRDFDREVARVMDQHGLPDYYQQEIERVKGKVLDAITPGCVTVGVYTDIHFNSAGSSDYDPNLRSVKAMRRLADELPIDCVINGGDTLTYCTHEFSAEIINSVQSIVSGGRAPHLMAKGDHDSAQTGGGQISKPEWAARTYPYMPEVVACPEEPNNFYYDIPNRMTRVIVLDTGTGMAGQDSKGSDYANGIMTAYQWLLRDVLTDSVKDGWRFIIFSHAPHDYEWNVGMVKRGALNGVRYSQVVLLDILDALNASRSFTATASGQTYRTFHYDADGVLTQDESGTAYSPVFGSLPETLSKDFSGWTSKVVLLASGHCHCDRLNMVSNGVERRYAIAYTGSAQYNGIKDAADYYIPCFGAEGRIATWTDTGDRHIGDISEALMDIYVVSPNGIDKIRFGAGSDKHVDLLI